MKLIDKDAIPWDVEGVGDIPVITKEEIDEMPTVDAEPVRHGRWIIDPQSQYGFPLHIYLKRKCSECGHSVDNPTPYCPWCGATMDAERK